MIKKACDLKKELSTLKKQDRPTYHELVRLGEQIFDACYKVEYLKGCYYKVLKVGIDGRACIEHTKDFDYKKASVGEINNLKHTLGVLKDPAYVDRNTK